MFSLYFRSVQIGQICSLFYVHLPIGHYLIICLLLLDMLVLPQELFMVIKSVTIRKEGKVHLYIKYHVFSLIFSLLLVTFALFLGIGRCIRIRRGHVNAGHLYLYICPVCMYFDTAQNTILGSKGGKE